MRGESARDSSQVWGKGTHIDVVTPRSFSVVVLDIDDENDCHDDLRGHAPQVVTHMTYLLFRNARGFPLVVHGISPASASLEALMTTERWLGTHDATDDIDCESLADVNQLLLITHLNYKSPRFIFRQGQSLRPESCE